MHRGSDGGNTIGIMHAERSSSDLNQIPDMLILVPSNLMSTCSICLAASRNRQQFAYDASLKHRGAVYARTKVLWWYRAIEHPHSSKQVYESGLVDRVQTAGSTRNFLVTPVYRHAWLDGSANTDPRMCGRTQMLPGTTLA